MSFNFRRKEQSGIAAAAVGAIALIAITLAGSTLAGSAGAAPAQGDTTTAKSPRPDPRGTMRPPPTGPAPDDSSMRAAGLLLSTRRAYGFPDTWNRLEGVRCFITYRIPGPDGAPVQEWTESHHLWLKPPVRARIDNATDSTLIVVRGDTTSVRRGGAWTDEPLMLAAARTQVLAALWLQQMPYNLFGNALKRRIDREPTKEDESFVVRVEYGEEQGRPAGTRARITFAPPGPVVRSVHWYDPRSKGWFLLELSNEKSRYGWTWAENRTLRSSDAEATAGPVVWTARVQDMQLEADMPVEVLAPAGIGASSDTSAARPGGAAGAR